MQKLVHVLITAVALQTSVTLFAADYVGIRVNAENFTSKSDEWYLTSPDSIPGIQPDPDGPHFTDASNSAYMEILPDTRVTHTDELVSGTNFWGGPNGSPRMEYLVDIPEAGTYTVWVKMYATGTEDNGIHVGINGTTPATGEKIQLCGGKNRWSWTSNQRTNENHCGVTQTISLDVPSAGPNTVIFYAREDGFELDQFILIKENNPDVEDCYPLLSDRIRCVDMQTGAQIDDTDLPLTLTINGNTSNIGSGTPALADIALDLDQDKSTIEVGDVSTITLTVNNLDSITAPSVQATFDLTDSLGYVDNSNCTESNNTVRCELGDITPGEEVSETFQVTGIATGQDRIDGKTSSDLADPVAANNSDSVQLTVVEATLAYDIQLDTVVTPNTFAENDTGIISIVLANEGTETFPQSQLVLTSEDGVAIDVNGLSCSQTDNGTTCDLPEIVSSSAYTASLTAQTPGEHTIQISIESNIDEQQLNNTNSTTISVINSETIAAENGSLVIEAENFRSQTINPNIAVPTWYRISGNSSATPEPDADDASAASASGGAYMEVLPDRRVTDNDETIADVTNFSAPGTGPGLSYSTFFTESGRYYIHALLRANGSQDNTLHFGTDDDWPESATSVSICNPTGAWAWASSKETNGVCDNNNRPYLDIPTPGFHTITLSQSEDGVEIDQFFLTTDESTTLTGIQLASAAYVNPDIDLAAVFTTIAEKATDNNQVSVAVEILNNDTTHTAVDISLTIDGLRSLLDSDYQTDGNCSRQGNQLNCTIPSIEAGNSKIIGMTFTTAASDQFQLTANVESAHTDLSLTNNLATTELTVESTTSGSGSISLSYLFLLLLACGSFKPAVTRSPASRLK